MTPDLRDVMRLGCGEVIQLGHVEVRIERALYSSIRVTVYRGRVTGTSGGRKSEPARGATVVVREVMDECSARVQSVISKLLTLRHPNIVRTFAGAASEDRSCYHLLQAWIGDSNMASAFLQEEGGRSPDDVELAGLSLSLSKAVEYLHSKGIIHCDITPFNVLLTDNGIPVVADFGIATLSDDPGRPKGYTPGYAPIELYPPEELPGDLTAGEWAIGPHTDRYMLGATMYAVACGRDGKGIHPITKMPVLVSPIDRARYDFGQGGSPQTPLAAARPEIDSRLASWIDELLQVEPGARLKSDADMVKRVTSIVRNAGKRRILPAIKLGRLKKPIKMLSAIAVVLILIFLMRHSYTLQNTPRNLFAFAVADVVGVFKGPDAALGILQNTSVPSAEISFAKGRIYERQGKPESALAAYKESQTLDPGYKRAISSVGMVRKSLGSISLSRGLQLHRAGEYYLANKQLIAALHYGVSSIDGYKALAHIAERRGELAKAAKYWDIVCKLQPSSVKGHYKASSLFIAVKHTEKAYHHAAKASDLHSKPKPEDDVSEDDLNSLLRDVSDACMRCARMDIAHVSSARRIQEKIVWLNRSQKILPSSEASMQLGRYYKRLGDLSSGDRRINYYAKSASCFADAGE